VGIKHEPPTHFPLRLQGVPKIFPFLQLGVARTHLPLPLELQGAPKCVQFEEELRILLIFD
jgi:hypothetical protein